MTCNLPRDFQVFWPKILWPQASSSCFPWAHCRQWRMAPKALAMWWKEKARSIPSVAPGVTWKAKKELWCHSFGSSQPLKKPWLIWWPPLPRVKMAHGPFQATRIPPRLKQESSYCITSPRMRTILWSSLPPGRGRRPADFLQACGSSFQLPSSTWTSLWSKGLWREKCECVLVSLKVWNPFHLDVAWFCLHEHSMLPVTCLITSLEMKLPKVWNPMLPSCGIFLAKHMSTQCLHIAPSFYQMVFSVALNPKWM